MSARAVARSRGALSTCTSVTSVASSRHRCTTWSGSPRSWNSAVHGFKNSQVKQSAEKIFLVDAMYWWVNRYGSGVQPGWKGLISNYDQTGERTHTGTVAAGAYNSERTVAWRHKGYANVVFFDGHGEQVRKDRFTTRDASGNLIPNMKMWDVSK